MAISFQLVVSHCLFEKEKDIADISEGFIELLRRREGIRVTCDPLMTYQAAAFDIAVKEGKDYKLFTTNIPFATTVSCIPARIRREMENRFEKMAISYFKRSGVTFNVELVGTYKEN